MKRGLKETLMTVAAAMLGLQAMAMAPVISDIPSPIVGGAVTATGTTPFIFGDALDLNTYVSDDVTADDQLKWSYAISGTAKYSINGIDPIDVATEDPNGVTAKQINNQVASRETVNPDKKANTITIRNINLSPFTGTGAAPSGDGIIDSQVVTLYASDGAAYSSATLMFYTDNGGNGRLSGDNKMSPIVNRAFKTSGAGTWSWDSPIGAATSSTAGGICIASPMSNGGMASWSSAYGELPRLVDNAVYRIRATMNYSQAQNGAQVPFWDVNIQNYKYNSGGTTSQGKNLFGGDTYFLDNSGGANAISSSNTDFQMWWCPVPVQTAQWKTGLASANDSDIQGLVQFRVIDLEADNTAGITPATRGGTICMGNLSIDRIDLSVLAAPSNLTEVYKRTSFTKNVDANASFFYDTTADFTGGTITVTPGTNAQKSEYVTVSPGDTNYNPGDGSTIPDNFPIALEASTLYMVSVNLSAPDQNAVDHPWDAFWVSMDTPTNEVISESFVTGAMNRMGMPKTGTAQTFTSFYYSCKGSNTTLTNGKNLRPKFAVGNNEGLAFNTNTGSVRMHSWTVNKIKTLPQ